MDKNDITILCSVVDNYGDIGVSYRLIRHLLEISKDLKIRLVIDNLKSFSLLNPHVDETKSFQTVDGIEVYDWKNYELCYKAFTDRPPHLILECFQCGQPDWLEKILFEDRVDHIVQIIMIDYLSAEPWVEDFHCLKSLTRTALVPKVNFMPGFTSKTGGLLFNKESAFFPGKLTEPQNSSALSESSSTLQKNSPVKKVLFFAYKDDWTLAVRAMNRVFSPETKVLVAGGAGQESILEACKKENAVFTSEPLPYQSQLDWDKLMCTTDFMIIRGEDSMAQACQTGIPFIWQAYPQQNDYQTVKMNALLDRMRAHFGEEFSLVEEAWKPVNKSDGDLEEGIFNFISNIDKLRPGFISFAKSLYTNGDLALNLVTFILKSVKID